MKFDINNQVKDVNSLNNALKILQGTLNTLMEQFSKQTGVISGNLQNIQSQGSSRSQAVGDVVPLSAVQRVSHNDFKRAQRLVTKVETGLEEGTVVQDFQKMVYRSTQTNAAGKPKFETDINEYLRNKSIRDSFVKANQTQSISAIKEIVPNQIPEFNEQKQETTSPGGRLPLRKGILGIGYSEADIPRMVMMQKAFTQQAENLTKLAGEMKKPEEKAVAIAMERISKDIEKYQQEFASTLNRYTEAITNNEPAEKIADAMEELRDSIGGLQKSFDDATKAEKDYKRGGGGGGDDGDRKGGLSETILRNRQMISAVGGSFMAGAGLYMGTSMGLTNVVHDAESKLAAAKGNLNYQVYEKRKEAENMTDAENLVKYRGNLLVPGRKMDYIGTAGLNQAFESAFKELDANIKKDLMERNYSILGKAAEGIGTATMAGATGNLMGGPLIGGLAAGAAMMNSTNQVLQSYINSPSTVLKGGLEKGTFINMIAEATGVKPENFDEKLKKTAEQLHSQYQNVVLDKVAGFQESGLLSNRDIVEATQKQQNLKKMRYDTFSQIGNVPALSDINKVLAPSFEYLGPIAPKYGKSAASELGLTDEEFTSRAMMIGATSGRRDSNNFNAWSRDVKSLSTLAGRGVGTFEQLAGNLTNLNQNLGGNQEANLRKLQDIFSKGFDNSRLAQNFVQTAANLTRSIDTRDIGQTAQNLTYASRLLDVSGKGDERSLQDAANAVLRYNDYTKTNLLSNAAKMSSVFSSGGSVGKGAFTISSMSAPEMDAALKQLETGAKIEDPKIKELLSMYGGDRSKLQETLRSAKTGSTSPMDQMYDLIYRDRSFSKDVEEIKKAKVGSKEREDALSSFMGRARQLGNITGEGDAFLGRASDALSSAGIRFEEIKKYAPKDFVDPAYKNMLEYINGIQSGARGSLSREVTKEDMADAFKKTPGARIFGMNVSGFEEKTKGMGSKESLSGVIGEKKTLMEMAGEAKMYADRFSPSGVTTVNIGNFDQLADILDKREKKVVSKALEKSTTQPGTPPFIGMNK